MPSRVAGRYQPKRWRFSPTAGYFWQPWLLTSYACTGIETLLTIDILFFIFILKNFMALPISLPGKHLTLPHSYPSIACALVHHSLQLRPFPYYDKLPDSHYLQCTTISNIYRIFTPELKWKKLPLKQIKFGKRRDNSWIFSELYCPAKVCGGLCMLITLLKLKCVRKSKVLKLKGSKCSSWNEITTTLNESNNYCIFDQISSLKVHELNLHLVRQRIVF